MRSNSELSPLPKTDNASSTVTVSDTQDTTFFNVSGTTLFSSSAVSSAANLYGDIVIVGDGPMALIVAIKLAQSGVNNLTVVGSHFGEYTRSGNFQHIVYQFVSAFLHPILVEPSPFYHVKDVERALYPYLEKFQIKTIAGQFTSLENNKRIAIHENNGNSISIHADVIFDCTGISRGVINNFNATHQSHQFEISKISDSKRFALIRFKKMYAKLFDVLNGLDDKTEQDKISNTFELQEVLNKHGWNKPHFPVCHARISGNNYSNVYHYNKVNVYIEVPDEFDETQALNMFTALINKIYSRIPLRTGVTWIDRTKHYTLNSSSRKHPGKNMVTVFDVNATAVSPGFFRGSSDLPVIVTAGDATCAVPFHIGAGLMLGIMRFSDMLKAFTISENKISNIDFNLLGQAYAEGNIFHTDLLTNTKVQFEKIEKFFNSMTDETTSHTAEQRRQGR